MHEHGPGEHQHDANEQRLIADQRKGLAEHDRNCDQERAIADEANEVHAVVEVPHRAQPDHRQQFDRAARDE